MSVELYDSQHPQAAKWLLPDGTVTYQLPIMGSVNSAGGGGGTDDHAELTNLEYENSGHTGFASAFTVQRIRDRVEVLEQIYPEFWYFKDVEFLPGLKMNRVQYGVMNLFWVTGEYTGAARLIGPGGDLVTEVDFRELELFGVRYPPITCTGSYAREAIGGGTSQYESLNFTFGSTGITVANNFGNDLRLSPADNKYQGTRVALSQMVILGGNGIHE